KEQLDAFLLGEAPRILFPFARRVLADAVRDGGFPPLMLEPIDFGGIYLQQRAQAELGQAGEPAGNA
ncbi:MAG TPA: protein-export chaperone SecB, partial [Sphingomonas sp.]|nr:protein-export chaperone SecB [Sphingomonas sp.]